MTDLGEQQIIVLEPVSSIFCVSVISSQVGSPAGYNALGQLVRVNDSDLSKTTVYTYDNAGNPLTYLNGMAFTWKDGRKLSSVFNIQEQGFIKTIINNTLGYNLYQASII